MNNQDLTPHSFWSRIDSIRVSQNKSWYSIAKAIGVDYHNLYNMRTHLPSLNTAKKLSAFLNVTIDELL